MMSVLIKGFEVPKDGCKDCAMVQRGKVFDTCPFLKQEVNGNVERGGKPNGCPLIEVTDTNVGDTISRQAAIEEVHANYDEILDFKSTGRTVADSIEDIINALPSAQRKKGKWMMKKVRDDGCGNVTYNCVCSECGVSAYEFSQPYCHRCGAPMDVEDD